MASGFSCWGYVRCPECLCLVPITAMEEGRHVCEAGQLAAAEVEKARRELEDFSVPEEWETRTTQFLRWLRLR